MRRALGYSLEQGFVGRLVGRLSVDHAARLRYRLRRFSRPARLGTLRRTAPLSDDFGYDRGTPIDRYYIEGFLSAHRTDVRGRVLEVKDSTYTETLGRDVTRTDVLDVDPANPVATIITDLVAAEVIADATFDCFILTQTLQFIYDVPAALRTVGRILKPGGVVLATVPGITPISRYDMDCYWWFTSMSIRRLFEAVFPAAQIDIEAHGNVLAASAFLYGMAAEELEQGELDVRDPDYPVVITIRAVRPTSPQPVTSATSKSQATAPSEERPRAGESTPSTSMSKAHSMKS
jgi:SAM-dependent methyltransferase